MRLGKSENGTIIIEREKATGRDREGEWEREREGNGGRDESKLELKNESSYNSVDAQHKNIETSFM